MYYFLVFIAFLVWFGDAHARNNLYCDNSAVRPLSTQHNTTQIETGDRQEGQAGGEGSSLERGGADQGPVPPQAESGGDQCRLEAEGRFLKEAPH